LTVAAGPGRQRRRRLPTTKGARRGALFREALTPTAILPGALDEITVGDHARFPG
jgi:hypothetical protein